MAMQTVEDIEARFVAVEKRLKTARDNIDVLLRGGALGFLGLTNQPDLPRSEAGQARFRLANGVPQVSIDGGDYQDFQFGGFSLFSDQPTLADADSGEGKIRLAGDKLQASVDGGAHWQSIALKIPGVRNVRDFGAVGDGVADDAPAFAAAIRSFGDVNFPNAPGSAGGTVFVPPGLYRMAGNLDVVRSIRLEGAGTGYAYNSSKLLFEAGFGVIIHSGQSSPAPNGQGSGSIIQNLQVAGRPVSFSPINGGLWNPLTDYAFGDKVRRLDDNRFYHQCIVAGQSGASEPADGAWAGALVFQPIKSWLYGTAYSVGDVVTPPDANGFYYVVDSITGTGTSGTTTIPMVNWPIVAGQTFIDNAGPNQIVWKCHGQGTWFAGKAYSNNQFVSPSTPNGLCYEVQGHSGTGTSGGVEPVWPIVTDETVIDNPGPNQIVWRCAGSEPTQTATDGTVVWLTKAHDGVRVYETSWIRDVLIGLWDYSHSFCNAGFRAYGATNGPTNTSSSGSAFEHCWAGATGIGFHIVGGDANKVSLRDCFGENIGAGLTSSAAAIAARAAFLLTDGSGPSSVGGGHLFYDQSFLGSHFSGCLASTAAQGDDIVAGRAYFGSVGSEGLTTVIGCYSEGDAGRSKVNGIVIGGDHGAGFEPDSSHQGNVGGSWFNMFFKQAHYPLAPNIRIKLIEKDGTMFPIYSDHEIGFATTALRYNFGDDPYGVYVESIGPTNHRRTRGRTGTRSTALGSGHQWVFHGEFRGEESDTPYWVGYSGFSDTDPAVRGWGQTASHYLPGDRFEKRQPDGAGKYIGSVVLTEGWRSGGTWVANADYSDFWGGAPTGFGAETVKPTTPNGFTYSLTKRGRSALVEPIWPTAFLGAGGIAPYTWGASANVIVGDHIHPIGHNGHYYKATAISGGEWSGVTGNTEPVWPTTPGSTVVDGFVTWTEQGTDDPATYVIDGGAEFYCIGPIPTYANYGLIDPRSQDFRAAAPSSGTWKRSDVVWNTAPASGQPIGWVCTAGGTPGTWAAFGTIA